METNTTPTRLNNSLIHDNWKRSPELRKRGRELLDLKENEFCVLGVGQVEVKKGCEDFIEIGKQVPNAQFRWIGSKPYGVLTEDVLKINTQIKDAPQNIKFAGLLSARVNLTPAYRFPAIILRPVPPI